MELMPHQKAALESLGNGRILYGGVGTGKSITAIAYYMKEEAPKDVYVITTAKKRDSCEWVGDAAAFGVGRDRGGTVAGVLTVDSWNNIGRYENVANSFFIFDEQRLVGTGSWVKSFLRIARRNRWILLSATPGDTWLDYAPVFIANGWYDNISDFKRQHVLYAPYVKFPKVIGYLGRSKLERQRNSVLVEMSYVSHTERYVNYIEVGYDKDLVQKLIKERWHPIENRPIENVAELWRLMRMVINTDPSRLVEVKRLLKAHGRMIIFYNFDYELEILRTLCEDTVVHEWNGHKHQELPTGSSWVYLVQYTAGSEGWNCITTDSMLFYSLTYSYKNFIQAQGRIDRLNTPYHKLYYYVLKSHSALDRTIISNLYDKKNFNEKKYLSENFPSD